MRRKNLIINKNSKVRRQRDPIPWKYCVLTVFCGLLLAAGFFGAAKQHFSAIGVAMENAELRVRILKLKDQKRKLLLSKERASSPRRIAHLAKSIGFSASRRPVVSSAAEYQSASAPSAEAKPVFSYAVSKDVQETGPPILTDSKTAKQKPSDARRSKTTEKKAVIGNQVAALRGNEIIKTLR